MRVHQARSKLSRLATDHPELTRGGRGWMQSLDELSAIVEGDMGKPNADRQRAFREAKKAQGYKSITVWVPGETHDKLTELAQGSGEAIQSDGVAAVIVRAIDAYAGTVTRNAKPVTRNTSSDARTVTRNSDRESLIQQCRQLREQGMGWPEIADHINAQGERNAKGELWNRKSIQRMVTRS